jgi:hypothetical protein
MAQKEYARASGEEVWLARFAPIAPAGESAIGRVAVAARLGIKAHARCCFTRAVEAPAKHLSAAIASRLASGTKAKLVATGGVLRCPSMLCRH